LQKAEAHALQISVGTGLQLAQEFDSPVRIGEAVMRRGWRAFISIVAVAIGTVAAPAYAQTPVETFVQQSINRGIAVMKDKSLDDAARRQQIGALLDEVLDTRKMALFMLGNQEQAASSDLDVYAEAYKAFTVANYASQLNGYGGQTLRVTGSVQRAPGDYIVNAAVVDPAMPNDPDPLPVAFRVAEEGGGRFAVVDASIMGIWLGLAQRAEFGAYLSQHGGDIAALSAHLQERAAKFSAPVTSAAH
jgi:phospholipid transport system substrate-binding protein